MYTNYSNNSQQPTFGIFRFSDGAKDIIKKNIKTPEKIKKFEELCNSELTGKRMNREISVNASLKNGSYSGSKLTANPGDKWYQQGFFQSPLSFLEKMINKADEVQNKNELSKSIDSIIDKLV